ncbi:MAG: YlxR family protein [Oscillatoriaceae cyanobacterium Prado104]|nr:YlxR family protein [Oscillatoriaceae cyanobacterium Prado104]
MPDARYPIPDTRCPMPHTPQQMKPNYRRCASCRKIAPKEAFWRAVRVYPSHQVQLDSGMGRSAYLCPEAECLKAAHKKNRLGRALKAPVPDELYQTLRQRLGASESVLQGREPDNNSPSDLQTPELTYRELPIAPAPKPQSDLPTSLKGFVSD